MLVPVHASTCFFYWHFQCVTNLYIPRKFFSKVYDFKREFCDRPKTKTDNITIIGRVLPDLSGLRFIIGPCREGCARIFTKSTTFFFCSMLTHTYIISSVWTRYHNQWRKIKRHSLFQRSTMHRENTTQMLHYYAEKKKNAIYNSWYRLEEESRNLGRGREAVPPNPGST